MSSRGLLSARLQPRPKMSPDLITIFQDLRYAFRQLRRSSGFTAVAITTLGLGISVNTAMFTVFNTVLLHPLPYPDSGRIVNITRQDGSADSLPMFSYWQQNSPGFDDVAAYDAGASSVNLHGG